MELTEVVRRRRMVRDYTDQPLAPEVIERILASALRAPSAGFSQGWAFLALTDPADRARFWPFVPTWVEKTPGMQKAPLVVVPLAHKAAYLERCAEPDKGWEDRCSRLLMRVWEPVFSASRPNISIRSATSSACRRSMRRSAASRSATARPIWRRKDRGLPSGASR